MPPLRKSSYSFRRCFTGSILLLGLGNGSVLAEGNAAGVVSFDSDASEVFSSVEIQVDEIPVGGKLSPLLAQAVLTYAPATSGTTAPVAHIPAAPSAWVPWNVAQALPAPNVLPAPGAVSPGGYYPAMPYPGGMWMMVWMPYGAPPYGSPGAPASGMATVPAGYLPPGWPQPAPGVGSIPPGGPVSPGQGYGAVPQGYPTAVVAVPWGVPYGVVPPGYGLPPGQSSGYSSGSVLADPAYGSVPPYGSGAPYASAPPTPSVPLTVPVLPGGPTAFIPGAPPPQLPEAWPQVAVPPSQAAMVPGVYAAPSVQAGNETWPPLASQNLGVNSAPLVPELVPDLGLVNPSLPDPNLDIQGLYVLQGDRSSARVRLSGDAFLTPNLLVGGALDLVTGPDLTNQDGIQLTELYLATSVAGAPGLRFRLGQLDLTSYFDRNSFAKDISRDFFNAVFQTNPALIGGANATASRPGGLVQWAVTDDITLNAAVFSSSADITDFALDGFAGEVGFRTGDLILRGTFITSRDTGFQGTGGRLDGYGINAEWFIPQANLGLFGRYGHLNNSGSSFSEDTYSFGLNVFDVFIENDRLGLGYGHNLSTTVASGRSPDALELFYDFEVISNIRIGFTFQQRDQFRESYAGFRIRSDWNLLPGRSLE